MVYTTIKRAVRRALGNLREIDFLTFCQELRDRREEPRVLYSDVEDKSVLQITDLLVSTFTELKAREVTLDILRLINCNEAAETLDSTTKACVDKGDPTFRKTSTGVGEEARGGGGGSEGASASTSSGFFAKKRILLEGGDAGNGRLVLSKCMIQLGKYKDSTTNVCVDKGDPTFRKTSTGELEMKPSQEALNHDGPLQAAGPGGPPASAKKPKEVEAEAKARVLSEGGDPRNGRLVLSRCTIQFGKYKGQSFKWLLENDVGYTAWLVADHQKQEDSTCQSPQTVNKDYLTQYAIAYPEVLKEVTFKSGRGKDLVGFGHHGSDTLQDLYESKDKDKISYVNFLRTMKSTCVPGTKMNVAVRYILQRDQNLSAAAASTTRRTTRPTNRPTTSFRDQRRRPTSASWSDGTEEAEELEDDDIPPAAPLVTLVSGLSSCGTHRLLRLK